MFVNRATLRNFNRRLSVARDLGTKPVRDLAAVRPCNDNQRGFSTTSYPRIHRPALVCRWQKTVAGALECIWHIDADGESAAEDGGISRLAGVCRIAGYPCFAAIAA